MNQVMLVTGPAGAGKTSVSEAICERFDRMMHVQVDLLRDWVRAGDRRSPGRITDPGGELGGAFEAGWRNVWVTGPAVLVFDSQLPDDF